jgi:gamma-glutamylcyclotransferase (GGCT)/AIG2-like uncharacterized protein YtfP
MKTLFCRVVLVCLGILLMAGASFGQVQDNGAASGNWSTPANWSLGLVPNNGNAGNNYNVSLLSSPAVNITLDISPTIDTLTLDSGSTLSTDAGTTLTTTGVTNGGTIEFNNGNTLTVNGSMTTSNYLDLDKGSKLVVTGNLTNSGQMYTNIQNDVTAANTITVDGTFTNNSGATAHIGYFGDTADVINVATLVNNGFLEVDTGATLNLTSQPNGVTDVVAGSELDVYGTLKAGSANGLAKLGSVEGSLYIANGQTFTDTPGSGTLTNSGTLDLELDSNVTVSGNLTNSGALYTNVRNQEISGHPNTLTVTGTFTNNSGATTHIGYFGDTTDVMNVATLVNNGFLEVDNGATLNLTSQPNGVTDVVGGSQLVVYGTLKAGTANALAKLGSIEGELVVGNGQTFTDTPGSGTLTISSGGELDLENFTGATKAGTNLTVSGNLTNSGNLYTNVQDDNEGFANTLTVTGAFTNNGTTVIGYFSNTDDVMNAATLINNGILDIQKGATLNLTSQLSGVTDVVSGSQLNVYGTLKAGTANGLAQLGSVEGSLTVGSGQTFTDTPGTGTLTISSTGRLDLESSTNMTVSGSLTNSGGLFTNAGADGGTNTLTVTGTFTNNAGANTQLGVYTNSTDVMNVATLVNNGSLTIGTSATLNLTSQPNGITDIVAGSNLVVNGTLKAGTANGLAKLGSVEGSLTVANGQTFTDTPGMGTLTISGTGHLDLDSSTKMTVSGNLTNSGGLFTNAGADGGANTLTVTGTFTNNSGANTQLGVFTNSTDVMNVATLVNNGTLTIGTSATLNLTNGGTATNTGTINVGSNAGGGAFKISGNTTLTGTTGKVILSNFASNIIGGTGTLTNVKNTISGSGNIGSGTMGLNNQGTIDANQSVPLIIDATGTVSNSFTMEATNGATLQLDAGTYTQTSAGSITASETGNLTSAVDLESGVIINGGKLTITGTTATVDLIGTAAALTLNGVTLSGTGSLQLPDGSTTTLLGTISNTSTIDVNSTGDATTLKIGTASVSLTGTGKIILASNGDDVITGGSGDILHTANTIEGPGNIGDGVIGVVNTGTIETVAHQTLLTTIDAGSAGFSNQGTVEAVATTTLYINNTANQFLNYNSGTLTGGTYIVDGILKVDGAAITTDAANITVSGAAAKFENGTGGNALSGLATIATGGTFDLIGQTFTTAGNFTNNGTLDVGASTKFVVLTGNTLTNYNSGTMTLTGGTYNVTGTLEFAGANIVNNDASITLTGTKALIENSTNSANALASFANNEAGATFALATAAKFTTANNFTNSGTLNVGTGSLFAVGTAGADTLTNYSSNTLTGGSYIVAGTGQIQFNNESTTGGIKTNDANITLSGTGSTFSFIDQNGANMLANLATNSSGATFDVTGGLAYTTSGSFTNNGTLTVGSSTSKFIVNAADTLTNFSGTTLTGGTYNVTGVLEFAGANIVNNAASITLTGTTSAIENSTAGNGLANFANNTSSASFTLAGNRSFTTVGSFTNAGVMVINKGSTFTVTGAGNNYTQSAGSTTVDGTLTVNAASMVDITGGSLFGATGSITGNVDLTGGVINPGDGANLIGELKITGTYTQGSAGATTIDLGGKTAITQYSVLDITKAATLSGTLNVTLVNGFTPVAGNIFTILDYLSETGTFTTLNLPTVSGDHWTVTYNAKDVVLTLVTGPGANVIVDNLTSDSASSSAASNTSAQSTVHGAPATRVSTFAGAAVSASNTHEPVAILSRATCFVARLLGSASCGAQSPAIGTSRGEMHAVASTGAGSREVHNNIMVATRTVSSAPGGTSHESSASATAMARLYVCAYMPSTVARTMGCN